MERMLLDLAEIDSVNRMFSGVDEKFREAQMQKYQTDYAQCMTELIQTTTEAVLPKMQIVP